MKSVTFFTLFCISLGFQLFPARAQPYENDHSFGLKIGANYSIWKPNPVETWCEFDTYYDYSAGLIFLKRLNSQFMLNIELLFTGKLYRVEYLVYDNSGLNSFETSRDEISFIIQIPLLLHYKLSGNQHKGVRLTVGPSVGIISRLWLYHGNKRHHPTLGVMFGLEYQLSHFLIGLRYEFNLNDTYQLNYGNTIISGKYDTISITVGWIF